MDGDNEFQQQEEQPIEQTETSYEPVDIAEAFKLARNLDKETTDIPVETGEVPEQQAEAPREYQPEGNSGEQYPDNGGYPSGGGTSISFGSLDYSGRMQQINNSMQQYAAISTKKIIDEKGYRRATMNDLAYRDEETGDIRFRNPDAGDKPDRYGNKRESYFNNRQEAQAWINSFNQQVEEKAKEIYNAEYNKIRKAQEPTIKLMQFAPKLDSMNDVEIDLLNGLIEPYEMKDKNGNVYGYNCDLNVAYNQAKRMFSSMGSKYANIRSKQESQRQQQEVRKPAVDMKAGGSTSNTLPNDDTFDDVKNLSDAFKKLRSMK